MPTTLTLTRPGWSGKYITVTVGDDGSQTLEAHGFSGGDCLKATADLERELCAAPSTRRRKVVTSAGASRAAKVGQ